MNTFDEDFLPYLDISREKCEKNIAEAKNYIKLDISNIASIISLYHPLEMIKMASWEERKVVKNSTDEKSMLSARLLPVLLQSIVESSLYKKTSLDRQIKKADWQRVLSLSEDLVRKLSRYIDSIAVLFMHEGKISRDNVLEYRKSLYSQFFPEEKSRKNIENDAYLTHAYIEREEDTVQSLFSMSSSALVNETFNLATYSLDAIDRLSEDSSRFKEKVEQRIRARRLDSLSEEDAKAIIFRDSDIYQESKRLEGLRDDFDLFRPDFSSSLSEKYLSFFALDPSSDTDLYSYLFEKGLWLSTCYPFIRFAGMYFTFVGKYMLSCSIRMLATRMNLYSRRDEATERALASLFSSTDVEGVYSLRGQKIDVVALSSLDEINAVLNAELYNIRLDRREAELLEKAKEGHKILYVDPDGYAELEKKGIDCFSVSTCALIMASDSSSKRADMYRMILGEEYDEDEEDITHIFDEEEGEKEIPYSDDDAVLSDDSSFFDEIESEDEEEKDTAIDEDIPLPDVTLPSLDEEKRNEYIRQYDEDMDFIRNELENKDLNDDYKGVDLGSYDDEDEEEETLADEEEDMESYLFDEFEEENEDLNQSDDELDEENDPDQLNFFDILDSDAEEERKDEYSYSDPLEEALLARKDNSDSSYLSMNEKDDGDASDSSTDQDEENAAFTSEDDSEKEEEAEEIENEEAEDSFEIKTDSHEDYPKYSDEESDMHDDSGFESEEEVTSVLDAGPEDDEESDRSEDYPEYPVEENASDFVKDDGPSSEIEDNEEPEPDDEEPEETQEYLEYLDEEDTSDLEKEDGVTSEEEKTEECSSPALACNTDENSEFIGKDMEGMSDSEKVDEDSSDSAKASFEMDEENYESSLKSEEMETDYDNPSREEECENVFELTEEDQRLGSFGEDEKNISLEYINEVESEGAEASGSAENGNISEVMMSESLPSSAEEDVEEMVDDETVEDEKEDESADKVVLEFGKDEHLSAEETAPGGDETENRKSILDLNNPRYSDLIRQIVRKLDGNLGVFHNFLEYEDRSVLDYFNQIVTNCWKAQRDDGKDKMFSIFEYDLSVLLAKGRVHDELRTSELINNAGAVMYSKGKTKWNALILSLNKDFEVESAKIESFSKDDFSPSNWKIVSIIGEELIRRSR
ncbi:MAG TPA: hypothetical protein IAB12_07225 [Candidatus Ornithospirochaeta avicola]|uniref:Uncharacterized protein n=1 Tax=Candidatus Ornithospirochaeta avicola TaxID=2840896 RepID=A0A9D1PVB4_9SPIO|nr:hypothetical protein [Candidatus Ornithospirochaeta avicola]